MEYLVSRLDKKFILKACFLFFILWGLVAPVSFYPITEGHIQLALATEEHSQEDQQDKEQENTEETIEQEAEISVDFLCTSVSVTSSKEISNVVLQYEDGSVQKFDGLSGSTGVFSGSEEHIEKNISTAWIKSGDNASGDGPGYGERFDSTAQCQEPEPDPDPEPEPEPDPEPEPPVCEENPSVDLQGHIVEETGTAVVSNDSSLCSYEVGLASYEKFDENIDNQILFDFDTTTIGPESEIELVVEVPDCNYQIDLFYGELIESFAGGDRYGERKLDFEHVFQGEYCSKEEPDPDPEPEPEPEPDTFSISGVKFNDVNENGVHDEDEPGLESWTITIEELSVLLSTTLTDVDGAYIFSGLEAGSYTVCEEQQEGWSQVFPETDNGCYEVTIEDANVEEINFGNVEVSEPNPDPDPNPNPDPEPDPEPEPECTSNCGGGGGGAVPPLPALRIEKEVEKEYAYPGDVITYTVVVKSISPQTAVNVVLVDVLPEGLLHVENNLTTQQWSLGDLKQNDEVTTTYQVLIDANISDGTYTNTAEVKADNHHSLFDDATIEVGRNGGGGGTPDVPQEDPPTSGAPPQDPQPPIQGTGFFSVLPETGVTFSQIVLWINVLFAFILLLIELLSFMVTGEFVLPWGNSKELVRRQARSYAFAGFGTIAAVFLFAVLAYPFVPMISYSANEPMPLISQEEWLEQMVEEELPQENIENYIAIPKINVRVAITEGSDATALRGGAWHLPGTSNPEEGSNMVLAAHRFRWNPPYEHTFYHLDKIENGDIVTVVWNGKEYRYRMVSSKVVAPTDVHVLDATDKSVITLVTCNPIFSVEERLVVTAELIES